MVIERQDNFTVQSWQGLELESTDEFIDDRSLTEATNCYLGIRGEVVKRPGAKWLNGLAEPGSFDIDTHFVLPLYHFVHGQTSADHKMMFYAEGPSSSRALLSLNGSGTWATAISNSSSPSISSDVVDGVQYGNTFYAASISNGVIKWTGSGTASLVASSPNLRQIISFKDRLWGIGSDSAQRSRLFYTNVPTGGGLPETWNTSTNFLEVGFGDGDQVNAILPFNDRIMIFKNGSIWNLYLATSPAQWLLRTATTELGCTSPYAVRMHKNVIYFVNVQGVWSTDGIAFAEISKPIRSYFRKRVEAFVNQLNDSISVWNDVLIIAIDNAGAPAADQKLVLTFRVDQEVQGWTRWKYFEVGATQPMPTRIVKQKSITTEGTFWFGSYPTMEGLWALDETLLRDQRTSAVTSDVIMTMKTKALDIGTISRIKNHTGGFLFATGETPGVEPVLTYIVDNDKEIPYTLTKDLIFMPRAYRLPAINRFRKMQVKIVETSQQDFKIDALHLLVMLGRQEPDIK